MRVARTNLVGVYLGLTLAVIWVIHVMSTGVWASPSEAERIHQAVLSGTADYPHQYRILIPWFCELLHSGGVPLRLAYLFQRFAFTFLAVLLLHDFLRRWVAEEAAFAGGVIFLLLQPFSCLGQGFQPTDPLNVLLFILCYDCLLLRRDGWLVVLVAIGMLNRETIGLVALLMAFVRLEECRTPGYWKLLGALVVVAAGIYLGLHLGFGSREAFTPLVTPGENIPENLTRVGSLRVVVLYGALWWYALREVRDQPVFLRQSIVLIPAFLLVHLCFGLLGETRYFLPLAPTILPLALRRLFPGSALEPESCG